MKKILLAASVMLGVLGAAPASAAVPSVLAGNTIGSGNDVVHVQMGWPGLSATLLHGLSDVADLGGRFTFNYGYEGITEIVPGFKIQGVLRLELVDTPRYNLGFTFDPGLMLYFDNGFPDDIMFGFTLPVALTFGLPINDKVMLNFGMNVPFFFAVNFEQFVVPILFGGGVEYQIDDKMAFTFNTRFGPAIFAYDFGSNSRFAFQTLFGLAFKL